MQNIDLYKSNKTSPVNVTDKWENTTYIMTLQMYNTSIKCINCGTSENWEWFISEIVSSVCTLLGIYITTVLILYQCKYKNESRLNSSRISISSHKGNSSRKHIFKNKKSKRKAGAGILSTSGPISGAYEETTFHALKLLSIFASIFVLLRSSSEQVRLLATAKYNEFCAVMISTQLSLHAIAIIIIYLFLWLRQRILYHHPAVRLITSKFMQTLSWSVLVFMFCGVIGTAVAFIFTSQFESTKVECEITSLPKAVSWIVLAIFTVTFQGMMLTLFIYPLLKQRHTMDSSTMQLQTSGCLEAVIRRILGAAIVCILSDLTAAIITISAQGRIFVANVAYDVNLIINLIGIICSFADWKMQLFPICWHLRNKEESNNGETRNQNSFRPPLNSIASLQQVINY